MKENAILDHFIDLLTAHFSSPSARADGIDYCLQAAQDSET